MSGVRMRLRRVREFYGWYWHARDYGRSIRWSLRFARDKMRNR
jgi:hypothetical protein